MCAFNIIWQNMEAKTMSRSIACHITKIFPSRETCSTVHQQTEVQQLLTWSLRDSVCCHLGSMCIALTCACGLPIWNFVTNLMTHHYRHTANLSIATSPFVSPITPIYILHLIFDPCGHHKQDYPLTTLVVTIWSVWLLVTVVGSSLNYLWNSFISHILYYCPHYHH